jgi:tight adherence protein B
MDPLLIGIAAFLGVSAIVGGVAMLAMGGSGSKVEDRLETLTGLNVGNPKDLKQKSLLAQPLDESPGVVQQLIERVSNINLNLLFEQADVSLTVGRLALISGVLSAAGMAASLALHLHPAAVPAAGLGMASLPLLWLWFRRRRRLKQFAVQLPDALDMLSRALRAGQSLASGFNLVTGEIGAPLGREFGRVFEEQNLGIPLEESLIAMSERIPNLDLKFFATAVILQRQTGGDLAEILDKIGDLVRERFKIWGQVQALTGEGRLSGVVLLALPVALFLVVHAINPEYVKPLFTDPAGKKMLGVAVFLQLVGALVIRKIVNIKV